MALGVAGLPLSKGGNDGGFCAWSACPRRELLSLGMGGAPLGGCCFVGPS